MAHARSRGARTEAARRRAARSAGGASTSRRGSGSSRSRVLLLLVVNPLLRLLVVELPAARQRRLHARQLRRRLQPRALPRGARSTRSCSGCRPARCACCSACRSPGRCRAPTCPRKGLVWVSILGTFIIPPYLGAVGWILLAGPNAGWLNQAVVALTGAEQGRSTSTRCRGWCWSSACYSFPYVFVFDEVGARPRLLGDGGRRATSSAPAPAHHAADHAAAGAAGDPRRASSSCSSRRSPCSARRRCSRCRGASTSSPRSSGSSSNTRRGSAWPPPTRCRCW